MKQQFTSQAFMQSPETVFAPLREQSAVVRIRLPIIGKVWLTTNAAATSAMLKDNHRFTMRKSAKSNSSEVAGVQWWMPRTIQLLATNMLTQDEPDHRRLRKLVDQAFQRRTILALEERVQAIAEDLVTNIQKDFRSTGESDLVGSFARPFPMAIICELLGIPNAIRDEFAQQAVRMTKMSGILSFLSALLPIRKMRLMLSDVIQDTQSRIQKGESVDGLIGDLVLVEADGDRLNHDELIAMVFLLLIAGHETTTHLISGSVVALLENPAQKQLLIDKPERIDMAVEELLRFVSPVQFSKPRHVRQSGKFHGVELKQGDLIMAGLASANYDPTEFDSPTKLDLTRRPNPHLEFGTGIHFCLGFQLARLELKVALRTLLTAAPQMCIGTDGAQWGQRMGLRVLDRLPIVEK